VEIHGSARRHGVKDADTLHALEHGLVAVDLEPDADPPKVLVVGPDRAGNLLEVILLELADDRYLVVHAMPLRAAFYDLLPWVQEIAAMTPAKKIYRTKTGRELTDADIEAAATEVEETDYDVAVLKARRGRPLLGSAPAEVVPVRLDPELREAIEQRAETEATTTSDVIRRALRAYLDVA
jgi:hypothetical protein